MSKVPSRRARRRIRVPLALDDHQVAQLVLKTDFCILTVQRWRDGKAVAPRTLRLLHRWAERLGIELKPRTPRPRRRRARMAIAA